MPPRKVETTQVDREVERRRTLGVYSHFGIHSPEHIRTLCTQRGIKLTDVFSPHNNSIDGHGLYISNFYKLTDEALRAYLATVQVDGENGSRVTDFSRIATSWANPQDGQPAPPSEMIPWDRETPMISDLAEYRPVLIETSAASQYTKTEEDNCLVRRPDNTINWHPTLKNFFSLTSSWRYSMAQRTNALMRMCIDYAPHLRPSIEDATFEEIISIILNNESILTEDEIWKKKLRNFHREPAQNLRNAIHNLVSIYSKVKKLTGKTYDFEKEPTFDWSLHKLVREAILELTTPQIKLIAWNHLKSCDESGITPFLTNLIEVLAQ